MYEKYNAYHIGVGGGGGEYVPQVGFGWSNAVALILLQQTYAPHSGSGSSGLSGPDIIALACGVTFVVLLFATWLAVYLFHPANHSSGDANRNTSTSSPGGAVDMRPISPQTHPAVGGKGVNFV